MIDRSSALGGQLQQLRATAAGLGRVALEREVGDLVSGNVAEEHELRLLGPRGSERPRRGAARLGSRLPRADGGAVRPGYWRCPQRSTGRADGGGAVRGPLRRSRQATPRYRELCGDARSASGIAPLAAPAWATNRTAWTPAALAGFASAAAGWLRTCSPSRRSGSSPCRVSPPRSRSARPCTTTTLRRRRRCPRRRCPAGRRRRPPLDHTCRLRRRRPRRCRHRLGDRAAADEAPASDRDHRQPRQRRCAGSRRGGDADPDDLAAGPADEPHDDRGPRSYESRYLVLPPFGTGPGRSYELSVTAGIAEAGGRDLYYGQTASVVLHVAG